MRSPLFALGFCLSIWSIIAARVAAAEPTPASVWKTDFTAAQAEAKKLNRPLVVHFYGNSCPPCRQMEKELLKSAQVLKILDGGFVAVKVCLDQEANLKIAGRFGVESMPTDLILSPAGKVLSRSEGYVAGSAQNYLANITRIDQQYAAERKRIARTEAPATEDRSKTSTKPEIAAAKSAPSGKVAASTARPVDKLVPPPTEPRIIASVPAATPSVESPSDRKKQDLQVSATAGASASPMTDQAGPPAAGLLLAMDGYCPVTLRSTRAWKSGSSEISCEHDGQTFYFTAPEKRDEFKADPARFAPKLLGCDPVVLADSDLAVRGSVKFGAFYEGELFLFETAQTRAKFRKDPTHYARLQHALKLEDIQKVASASGN